jgi:hypothetical protein
VALHGIILRTRVFLNSLIDLIIGIILTFTIQQAVVVEIFEAVEDLAEWANYKLYSKFFYKVENI